MKLEAMLLLMQSHLEVRKRTKKCRADLRNLEVRNGTKMPCSF